MEIKRVQDECSLADIDFEFVIDSSGSVGQTNWKITMDYIAQYWIQGKSYTTLKSGLWCIDLIFKISND